MRSAELSDRHMPFGRYAGVSLSKLPLDYLRWVSTLDLRDPLRLEVDAELLARGEPPVPPPTTSRYSGVVRVEVPSLDSDLAETALAIVEAGASALTALERPPRGLLRAKTTLRTLVKAAASSTTQAALGASR